MNKTMKFGLIGHPIGHSVSAAMHNSVFGKLKLDYTYESFDVAPKNLKEFMENPEGFAGLNVTIPHKVSVIEYVDELDETAQHIGAVNTLKFENKIKGYNTDPKGFQRSLEREGIETEHKNVLVVGAGGAARAILYCLSSQNANITLSNRTEQKAIDLVKELEKNTGNGIDFINYNNENLKKILEKTDILINTSSVGMYPNINNSPIPSNILNENLIVFDIIYNPIKTKLLRDAEKIGCKIIEGLDMLVEQAAESLRIWLEIDPPTEIMKEAAIRILNP